MFYGRKEELNALDELWGRSVPSLVVCRGRRRIGKSTLIGEFVRRSKAKMFIFEGVAPKPGVTNATQLERFARQLAEQPEVHRAARSGDQERTFCQDRSGRAS